MTPRAIACEKRRTWRRERFGYAGGTDLRFRILVSDVIPLPRPFGKVGTTACLVGQWPAPVHDAAETEPRRCRH